MSTKFHKQKCQKSNNVFVLNTNFHEIKTYKVNLWKQKSKQRKLNQIINKHEIVNKKVNKKK